MSPVRYLAGLTLFLELRLVPGLDIVQVFIIKFKAMTRVIVHQLLHMSQLLPPGLLMYLSLLLDLFEFLFASVFDLGEFGGLLLQ
jgi:hypothetical protein